MDSSDTLPEGESEETEKTEPETEAIEQYLRNEDEIRNVLDEAKDLQVRGKHVEVRELLTDLSSGHSDAFRVITAALTEGEEFFDEIEEIMGTQIRERLDELPMEYQDLTMEISMARSLSNHYRKNVPTDGSLSIQYSYANEEPIVDHELLSGDISLLNIRAEPSLFFHTAWLLTDAATAGFEDAVENSSPVNETEIQHTKQMVSSLQSRLAEVEDAIESLNSQEDVIQDDSDNASSSTEGTDDLDK